MRRAREYILASCCVFGVLLAGGKASAQPKAQAPGAGPAHPKGQAPGAEKFTLGQRNPGAAEAQAAREHARSGDCAGALTSFDVAVERSQDPTIRRDRGLCHEKLGDPYPAIDDFRAYLTAFPEAADAEAIRERLASLEEQTLGHSSKKKDDKDDGGGWSDDGSASVNASDDGTTAKVTASADAKPAEAPLEYQERVAREEAEDQANGSPLRRGRGLVLGPFISVPRFFIGTGAEKSAAYAAGIALRYSLGRKVTILSELGFAGIGTSGEVTAQSAPLLFGGVEYRAPLQKAAFDHLLFRGGIGYEHYVTSGTRAITNDVLARFSFGYRHTFGTSIGLEVLLDGGPVHLSPDGAASRWNAVIGGSYALVVGF